MEELSWSVSDRIGAITLNRPEKRNALTLAMIHKWAKILGAHDSGR